MTDMRIRRRAVAVLKSADQSGQGVVDRSRNAEAPAPKGYRPADLIDFRGALGPDVLEHGGDVVRRGPGHLPGMGRRGRKHQSDPLGPGPRPRLPHRLIHDGGHVRVVKKLAVAQSGSRRSGG